MRGAWTFGYGLTPGPGNRCRRIGACITSCTADQLHERTSSVPIACLRRSSYRHVPRDGRLVRRRRYSQSVVPISVWRKVYPTAIVVRAAVVPPNGPPLAQIQFRSIHSRTRRFQHARIVSALGLFDISPSIHQIVHKALPFAFTQRRVRAAPELTLTTK